MRSPALAPVLLALALAVPAAAGPGVTIYTHDLGFVRESRTLALRGGLDTLRLEEISNRLDFSSVRLAPAAGRVRRLAYRWDVATGDELIEHARGLRVRVLSRGDRVAEGTLLSADGSWLVVRTDDGSLSTLSRAAVEAVQLSRPAGTLALKPAIEAVIDGGRGNVAAELSYLTGGLSWTAEHTLVRTGETRAVWSAVVQVENTTGRDYVDATLKLVAGEPARAAAPVRRAEPMMMMKAMADGAGAAEMTEASFADYHLYSVKGTATLRDRETQSLVMIEPRPITVAPRYLYRGGDSRGVLSQLEVVNSEKDGPGVPLPAGRVRCFQPDDSGALQFVGETTVSHTPVDEKRTLDLGYTFDLAAERRQMAERRVSDREREYDVELRLRNRKSSPVSIVVEEGIGGDTTLLKQSHPSTRKDAGTLQFTIDVPAGREVVLTYTARQRW
jgi:hypothetical protein